MTCILGNTVHANSLYFVKQIGLLIAQYIIYPTWQCKPYIDRDHTSCGDIDITILSNYNQDHMKAIWEILNYVIILILNELSAKVRFHNGKRANNTKLEVTDTIM